MKGPMSIVYISTENDDGSYCMYVRGEIASPIYSLCTHISDWISLWMRHILYILYYTKLNIPNSTPYVYIRIRIYITQFHTHPLFFFGNFWSLLFPILWLAFFFCALVDFIIIEAMFGCLVPLCPCNRNTFIGEWVR